MDLGYIFMYYFLPKVSIIPSTPAMAMSIIIRTTIPIAMKQPHPVPKPLLTPSLNGVELSSSIYMFIITLFEQ